jgi:hypothetical protein
MGLSERAAYRPNKDWGEVEAGDFMWLRAFCPQACYPAAQAGSATCSTRTSTGTCRSRSRGDTSAADDGVSVSPMRVPSS